MRHLVTPREARSILHGDLHAANFTVDRGKINIFDFEWITWGLPIHDLARWLYFEVHQNLFMGYEVPENRAALVAEFKRGYRSRRAWPKDKAAMNALVAMMLVDSVSQRRSVENSEQLALAMGALEVLICFKARNR